MIIVKINENRTDYKFDFSCCGECPMCHDATGSCNFVEGTAFLDDYDYENRPEYCPIDEITIE